MTPPFDVGAAETLSRPRPEPAPIAAAPELTVVAPRVVSHRHSMRDRAVRRLLALSDALAITLALIVAFAGQPGMWSYVGWGLLMVAPCLAIYNAYGLYDADIKRISRSSVDDLPALMHALLIGCLLLWLYYHLVPSGTIHFKHVLLFGVVALASTLTFRALARRTIHRRLGPERVLLVGDDDSIAVVAGKLAGHPEYGVKAVGLVSARREATAATEGGAVSSLHRLGALHELDIDAVVAELGIHRIVVSDGEVRSDTLLELVRRAQELGVKVAVVPRPFDAMGPSVEIDNVEGLTILGMHPPVLSRSSRIVKRALDIVGSLAMLLACTPLLVAIVLAIKLDSRGPVLFRQRRVGRGGRRFYVLKFRTMVDHADRMVDGLLADSRDPDWLLLDCDPRVTRVGRALRRTSLDELPQLWNVLKGEMSLVGPRPLIESEDCKIHGWGRSRIDLTPGMTGLWQVLGRTSIPFSGMITLDYLYVTNWSLWRDVKLLLSTVPALLSQRGAN
jgi:exopolysaccharide biosynthesis polyprenyl glycosylphosphotransferase